MRVFELTAHVKAISRADGRTATAAAAYRACCVIDCDREGRTHDYSRKGGLVVAEVMAPDDAPDWAKDRAALWNAAELAERNKDKRAKHKDKANARPARELLFSFPVELSPSGRLQAARTIARYLIERHQVGADFAIHQPGREGDQRNFHCHLMWTARRLSGQGFGAKTREWDNFKSGRDQVKALREFVARTLNEALAAEGHGDAVHVEHRSFKDRGETGRPTSHDGPGRTSAQRREQAQARAAWRQATATRQEARHREERAALFASQDFARRTKLDHLTEQERRGIAVVRDRLAQENAADQAARGVRRALDVATGRASQDDQARAQRVADRTALADRTIAEFAKGMQAERAAYEDRQRDEARGLADRQAGEDRQLQQAAAARRTADQLALVQARRDRVQEQARTIDLDRSRSR